MADIDKDESDSLQVEFEWLLRKEVHAVLAQLQNILQECGRRFPVPLFGTDGPQKQDKFVLTTPPDQLKCIVSVMGDNITQAEITLKVQRQQNVIYRTSIQNDSPWKLQQVQDAGNHLQHALQHIDSVDPDYSFRSSEEVLHLLGDILGCLQRGRTSLIVPRKRTIDDLMKSRNMRSLVPNLPEDLAISFYIQSHKLVLAVYHLSTVHGNLKFDTFQAECSVPWISEVLVLFTVALQLCQQLKDKICVFSQYKDFSATSTNTAAVVW
ncbi:protein rogdi [Frankliniella occidentalis]|uniref:Protein rogdi n=1 Tax=Frankliniella occidentalis TaxID=133901 RepID=A0A6J1TAA6_FRAOC|nr:protein rogdi [Frankliniella occidentalis]